jgi:lipid-A-disaccharide synthase
MRPLRIAIIAGEESGDQLGADLVRSLHASTGRKMELIGIGGVHLANEGLVSLQDPRRLAIMGVTAVIKDLPGLISMIGSTARAIAAARPDCLITIDSPAFNLRVSKKVRALAPSIPIVKYVSPSVWAWGPGRARAMKAYVDHVLCILPFEPAVLERLGGPPGTYVGHRMTHEPGLLAAQSSQAIRRTGGREGKRTLLVLPGSRRAEVKSLTKPFGEIVHVMAERGDNFRVVMPTVPHVAPLLSGLTANWAVKPEIVEDSASKWKVFGQADAALAASGTVLLELALAGVPTVSCYKTDVIFTLMQRVITIWSAALPNIIADRAIVPEFYNDSIRPQMLARYLEGYLADGAARDAQLGGFDRVRSLMATRRPSGEIAAEVVLRTIESKSPDASAK